MFRKGIFWTIGEHSYFVYYPIISYFMIKFYGVETMDMGRFLRNIGVSGKYNPSKYCGIIPPKGTGGPLWGQVKFICLSVCTYVCPSICLSIMSSTSLFGDHLCGLLNLNEPKL